MGVSRDVIRRVLNELNLKHPETPKYSIMDVLSKINKDKSGCWNWTGPKANNGYGRISFQNEHLIAHRLVYKLLKGEIPKGMNLCHSCDNPQCCNPDHMFIGTQKDNMIDCLKKNRSASAKLKYEEVQAIRSLSDAGIDIKQLALMYGVSKKQIKRIIKGIAWAFN